MGYRGVIWDMDGVLVDTGDLHYLAWEQVLPDYGIVFEYERFLATFGMNNAGILDLLLDGTPEPALVAEISSRKEAAFREAARGNVQPLPGAAEWLERLGAAGYRQAIASSAPLDNIHEVVDELGLREYFAALVSGFALPGKPDPATFLAAARDIEVPPKHCIVVEDATAGVEGARRAGMRCIAVTTTNAAEALQGADIVVDQLDVLPRDAFDRLLATKSLDPTNTG
jgi:beta-phosphoglucomutase family hydrolase